MVIYMLKVDRHKIIEALLQEHGSIMVSSLSLQLDVTEETIRRDLEELEQQHKLKRVRGGAYLPEEFDKEVPIRIRENIYNTEKERIALKCLEYIESGDTLMLDSSTTAIQLAVKIKESKKNVTIITNSLKISQLAEDAAGIKLICSGGVLRKSSDSFVGYSATDTLINYYADKAFVSCSTLGQEFGVTDNSSREAAVRKVLLTNSVIKYLIVDHTKFDNPSLHKICDFSAIGNVITDKAIDTDAGDYFEKIGVKVIVAQ